MLDAGGGGNIESTESEDDSCGDGFYVRKDQLLTRYVEDGSPKWCWDEFEDAPIDHSAPRVLSMERLGSRGTVNAYVDGRFQASLQASNDQYILGGDDIGTAIRLHDRGDHAENGYVYHASIQKVGVKRARGSFTRTFRTDRPVEWKRLEVVGETPTETGIETRFRRPGDDHSWHSSPEDVPVSAAITVEVALETDRPRRTPRIHELRMSYDST